MAFAGSDTPTAGRDSPTGRTVIVADARRPERAGRASPLASAVRRSPAASPAEANAVRQWLEDAWRHGAVVVDTDRAVRTGVVRARPAGRARCTAGALAIGRWIAVASLLLIVVSLLVLTIWTETLGGAGLLGRLG
jgi:hypothetical protein